jgi:hypothetical protein
VSKSSVSFVGFRWLLALLIAFSLIAPRHTPPGAPLPERAEAVALAADCGGVEEAAAESGDSHGTAEYGDTHSGDSPHELDKIPSPFSLFWSAAAPPWGGVYLAGTSPDPVFSFDRPPKRALSPA